MKTTVILNLILNKFTLYQIYIPMHYLCKNWNLAEKKWLRFYRSHWVPEIVFRIFVSLSSKYSNSKITTFWVTVNMTKFLRIYRPILRFFDFLWFYLVCYLAIKVKGKHLYVTCDTPPCNVLKINRTVPEDLIFNTLTALKNWEKFRLLVMGANFGPSFLKILTNGKKSEIGFRYTFCQVTYRGDFVFLRQWLLCYFFLQSWLPASLSTLPWHVLWQW